MKKKSLQQRLTHANDKRCILADKKNMLGLRTTIYMVDSLHDAKIWYSKVFEMKPYFDESFYVGFNVDGYELGLLPEEKPNEDKAVSVLSYWSVENIQDEYTRLISLGALPHEDPTNHGGDLMTASVFDPWGNVLGIIYNPYFKNSTN